VSAELLSPAPRVPPEPAIGARPVQSSTRELLARGLERSGAGRILRRPGLWRGVVVLAYHRIGDGSGATLDRELWSATVEQLDRQLRLVKRDFEIIGPDQLTDGSRGRPGRRVMITFDDGYRDLRELAFAVLEDNGVKATLFLCTGFLDGVASAWWDEIAWMIRTSTRAGLRVGPWSSVPLAAGGAGQASTIECVNHAYRAQPAARWESFLEEVGEATGTGRRPAADAVSDWISWDDAREMQAAGHEIGAHTVSHPVLARLSAEEQRGEITGSIERIEQELGRRPRYFCYPLGRRDSYSEDTRTALGEAGIDLAFSDYGGYVGRGRLRRYDVVRTNVGHGMSDARFAAVLTLPQVFARE
jgi:peptidoglycan/xylan/chitin deacetylase (PgdA/CDA1 family)